MTIQRGDPPFSRDAMRAAVPEFLRLYAERPIFANHGGMRAPHLFGTWFMVRAIAPTHIVESGVFKGLGTWLLEQAAPEARLTCIDPDPSALVYRSSRATYLTEDFSTIAWDLPRETTLLFFDDHQDAPARVTAARRMGFRHLIFEDNYPPGQGDCASLKQAFMGALPKRRAGLLERLLGKGPPEAGDETVAAELGRALDGYYEFPPVLTVATTRWGDPWTEERYPTPEPLFSDPSQVPAGGGELFLAEAQFYTWICYASLRRDAGA